MPGYIVACNKSKSTMTVCRLHACLAPFVSLPLAIFRLPVPFHPGCGPLLFSLLRRPTHIARVMWVRWSCHCDKVDGRWARQSNGMAVHILCNENYVSSATWQAFRPRLVCEIFSYSPFIRRNVRCRRTLHGYKMRAAATHCALGKGAKTMPTRHKPNARKIGCDRQKETKKQKISESQMNRYPPQSPSVDWWEAANDRVSRWENEKPSNNERNAFGHFDFGLQPNGRLRIPKMHFCLGSVAACRPWSPENAHIH